MRARRHVTWVGSLAVLAALLWLVPAPWSSAADGVVTDCRTDIQFSSLLASGGTITFDCGTALIPLSSSKVIFATTTIDGGDQITLSGNNAHRLFEVSAAASLTLRNIVLTDGFGTGDGGAIFNRGALTLEHSTIRASKSTASGGAIVSYGPLTISDSLLEDNEALNGGALYPRFPAAQTTIRSSELRDNHATDTTNGWGGAILAWDGAPITIEGSDITGNTARGGGGIFNFSSTAMLSNVTISGNTATSYGGGIYNFRSTATLSNVTISGNTATSDNGGGIYNYQSRATLSNVTISGNAASYGGGIYNIGGLSSTVTLNHVTLSGNTAAQSGGGISGNSGSVTVQHTIVANSPSGANCGGQVIDAGFNLASDSTCGFTLVPNVMLGPLANNGGGTQTHLPQPGSPAIDLVAVGCPPPATDQRGTARPVDGDGNGTALCDAGAVEWTASPPPSPSPEPSSTPSPEPSPSTTPGLQRIYLPLAVR